MEDKIIIDISDSEPEQQDEKGNNKTTNSKVVSEVKLAIENDKMSCKAKLDELRNKVSNLRKRQKAGNVEETGEEKEKITAKKIKRHDSSVNMESHTRTSVEDLNGSSASKLKTVLPSFKLMSEVSFDSVIKPDQVSLLEAQYTDTNSDTNHSVSVENVSHSHDNATESISNESASQFVPLIHSVPETAKKYMESIIDQNVTNRDDEPLVQVIFRNEEIARIYRNAVQNAIVEVLAIRDHEVDTSKDFPGVKLNIWESAVPEPSDDFGENLFKVDTLPARVQFSHQVPKYQQTYKSALQEGSSKEEGKGKSEGESYGQNSCFNCDGAHTLRNCPQTINQETVFKNRQKYNNNKKVQLRTSRYHIDEEQKFAHLTPGTISSSLREALGLHKDQLPRFVYRMRMFGYPPGWLEEARVTHSGIALINDSCSSDTNTVADGENDGSKVTYDISKIVDYPGFNVLVKGMVDESAWHRCPPMHWDHSKEAMIRDLGSSASKGYKRKKSLKRDSLPADKSLMTNDDMEVVEIDDEVMIVLDSTADSELCEEIQQSSTSPDSPPTISTLSHVKDCNRDSPSLAMLEAKKQKLLVELEESSNSTTAPATPDRASSPCVFHTPEPTRGRSVSLTMGTPVLESHSPFAALPCADKFSQGISDHLNFENLPDATGKYERMKGIINKVKDIANQVQQEDDHL